MAAGFERDCLTKKRGSIPLSRKRQAPLARSLALCVDFAGFEQFDLAGPCYRVLKTSPFRAGCTDPPLYVQGQKSHALGMDAAPYRHLVDLVYC